MFKVGDMVTVVDTFTEFMQANRDSIHEGLRLGLARYTLAPLSPRQVTEVVITLTFTAKYYNQIGRDIPVSELRAVLDKLVADPS